jgi:hypothetical protein
MGAVLLANAAIAQEQQAEPTLAAKAALQSMLAGDGRSWRMMFPQPTCLFRGGLCGAVRRDLTVAVPPRYDWVGRFFEGRAAVRLSGLYGFVDEDGREIVEPKYRIVGDYDGFGFAQVDVNGKSGLIDRDGKMVIEPKYGFIIAIGRSLSCGGDTMGGRKERLRGLFRRALCCPRLEDNRANAVAADGPARE